MRVQLLHLLMLYHFHDGSKNATIDFMIRSDHKSDCAINFSLESFGDPWSLLLIRDIAFYGKTEFGEFLGSDERIGSNTLSRRLASLESQGIVSKRKSDSDQRKERYELTEKGLALVPILVELTLWGATYDPDTGASPEQVDAMRSDHERFTASIQAVAPQSGL